jgi:hypothetical protein
LPGLMGLNLATWPPPFHGPPPLPDRSITDHV